VRVSRANLGAAGAASPVILEPHALLAHGTDPFYSTCNCCATPIFRNFSSPTTLIWGHFLPFYRCTMRQRLFEAMELHFTKLLTIAKLPLSLHKRSKSLNFMTHAIFHTKEPPFSRCTLEGLSIFSCDKIMATSGDRVKEIAAVLIKQCPRRSKKLLRPDVNLSCLAVLS
jgi:hypothetical protein